MNNALLSNVNWLAVLVAALAYFILGAIWYSKALFGPKWAVLVGMNMNDPSKSQGFVQMMLATFILIVVACIGQAWLVNRMDLFILSSGIKLGALTGICFATTAIAISFVYEKRPTALYLIDCGYHIAGNLAAAIILVMWR